MFFPGEICTAFAAGYVTAEEAIAIAYYRGLAVSESCGKGAMMAVGLGHITAAELISSLDLQQKLCVACINSPENTTVSGESDALDKLLLSLQDRRIFVRKLKTDDRAYHSHMMEPIGQRYEELLLPIFSKRPSICHGTAEVMMFSSVTSQLTDGDLVGTASYWRTNLESPVMFSGAMEQLLLSGTYRLIEIGPHPALGQSVRDIQQHLQNAEMRYSSTLSRGRNAVTTMLELAGALYLHGYTLQFQSINGISSASTASHQPRTEFARVMHSLPAYAWHHEEPLWNESRICSDFLNMKYPRHDLLGSRVPGSPGETTWWRNTLKVQEVPWLQDHKLGQTIVFPAAGYLAMAIEGLSQMQDYSMEGLITFRQVHLMNMLILPPEKDGVEISLRLEPERLSGVTSSNIWWHFEVISHSAERTTTHANGLIAVDPRSSTISRRFHIPESTMEQQATRTWYERLAKKGLIFGPHFRSMTEIHIDRGRSLPYAVSRTLLRPADGQVSGKESRYILHPVTIDSLLQTGIIASAKGTVQNLHGKVPVTIGRLDLLPDSSSHSSNTCTVRAGSKRVGFGTIILSAELENESGRMIAQIEDVRAIPYAETSLQAQSNLKRNPMLRILWKPDISKISSKGSQEFAGYLNRFASFLPKELADSGLAYLAGALDLVTHHNGRMKILQLDDDGENALGDLVDQLSIGNSLNHFETYTRASMTTDGELLRYDIPSEARFSTGKMESRRLKPESNFDVVLAPSVSLPRAYSMTNYTNSSTASSCKHVPRHSHGPCFEVLGAKRGFALHHRPFHLYTSGCEAVLYPVCEAN